MRPCVVWCSRNDQLVRFSTDESDHLVYFSYLKWTTPILQQFFWFILGEPPPGRPNNSLPPSMLRRQRPSCRTFPFAYFGPAARFVGTNHSIIVALLSRHVRMFAVPWFFPRVQVKRTLTRELVFCRGLILSCVGWFPWWNVQYYCTRPSPAASACPNRPYIVSNKLVCDFSS